MPNGETVARAMRGYFIEDFILNAFTILFLGAFNNVRILHLWISQIYLFVNITIKVLAPDVGEPI